MMYENVKGQSATASLELAATAKTKFDEFLRRQLGISNAGDPESVVAALRKLYPSTAARLDDESKGVAIRQLNEPELPVKAPTGGAASPGQQHYALVMQALEADLKSVVEHSSNRDYKAPLAGWRDAILAELGEGEAAAYQAADAAQRDRTFYSVRKLGDYARVARMVGLLNPALNLEFRRLASTIDEAAISLRVLAGDALFRAGFDEGGTVFQVALDDLRQRRETLINALDRFVSNHSEDADDWGDGEASYGALLRTLGEQGHLELRAILRPQAMARLLNVLLDNVPQQQPDYLRGIASTVPVELVQLRRLLAVATDLLGRRSGESQAASGPLSNFVQALNLFIDAFARPGTGSRLLNISLPAPFASLQLARADEGTGIVRELFQLRTKLATELDAVHTDPDFDPLQWPIPVKLDRVLYDVDRAIDLYLMGGGNNLDGVEERRARMYAVMLQRWLDQMADAPPGPDWQKATPKSTAKQKLRKKLRKLVRAVIDQLDTAPQLPSEADRERFMQEQRTLEAEWKALALELTLPATGRRGLLEQAGALYVGLKGSMKTKEKIDTAPIRPLRASTDEIAHRSAELVQKVSDANRSLGHLDELKALLAGTVQNRLGELEDKIRTLEERQRVRERAAPADTGEDELEKLRAEVDARSARWGL